MQKYKTRIQLTRQSDTLNDRQPSEHLLQLGTDLFMPYTAPTLQKISLKLTAACKALKEQQKDAATLRDDYLEEVATLQITHNHTDLATIIKNIRHKKELKQPFKLIRPISKGTQGGA
eukprot:6737112-Ditylum_brightwellii.AAC.1